MAGFFSSNFLERVRAASDIVDVIGSYLPLKRAGANFVALCPFHKEKTPSFNVNPQKQIFHCFGCHKGGDVFRFVAEHENVDFPEAVGRLAERARIPLEYEGGGGPDHKARFLKETLFRIHEEIAQRWHNTLLNEAAGEPARRYLQSRAVTLESIQTFRLGAAPDLWDDTVNWGRSKGFNVEDLEKAGLVLKRESGSGYYDRFRGRLMFPICDEQGRVIGFSGRILVGDEKSAKYVNSPETPIFTKSKVFFGLDKSKRALLESGHAIICEGQLDLISCYMAGIQNMVAPQGTAFTAEHGRILKRYVNEVVLCFDSDEAGQNAAVRSLDHLLSSGLAVRVAVVPPPHDPDSFIRSSGGQAFKDLVAKAPGFFDYYLQRLCTQHDLNSDKGRLAILRAMSEAVLKTANSVLIDKYAQVTALRLAVSADAVRTEFRKDARSRAPERAPDALPAPQMAQPEAPSPQEYWLLKLLLLNEDMAEWTSTHLDPAWIQHPGVRHVILRYLDAYADGTWTTLAGFLDGIESPEIRMLITEAATEDKPLPNPRQQVEDLVLRLRNQSIDRELQKMVFAAGQPGLSEDQKIEFLRAQQHLRHQKRQALEPLQK